MSPLEYLDWQIDGTGSLPLSDIRVVMEVLYALESFRSYCGANAQHLGTSDLRGLVWSEVAKRLAQAMEPLEKVGT